MKRIEEDLYFIAGISFHSVAQIQREMPVSKSTVKLIKSQPGYKSGTEMCIAKAKSGGYRLFTRVDGKWMDSSLQDIV